MAAGDSFWIRLRHIFRKHRRNPSTLEQTGPKSSKTSCKSDADSPINPTPPKHPTTPGPLTSLTPTSVDERIAGHKDDGTSMALAINKHVQSCKYTSKHGSKCPCLSIDVYNVEDGLHLIEIAEEEKKPWLREKLKLALPSLKAMEPWLDIIDAVAQVNPISGHVSGVVKVALKLAIVIGDDFDDVIVALRQVRELLCLLALYEKNGTPPELIEDITQAYVNIFDFLCAQNAHKRARDDAESRLSESVQRLNSKASPVLISMINELRSNYTTVQTLAELERKGTECLKELHDNGARNEMGVDLDRPADGTCDWVYDKSNSQELRIWRDWRDSSDSGILLLIGDIGTGKSTLVFQLVETLRNDPALQSRLVIACFGKFQGEDTSKYILRGLLYSIAEENKIARNVLIQHRDHHSNSATVRNFNAFESFQSLKDCFKKCIENREKELCLIIDGLDQCPEESRKPLVNLFKDLVKVAKLQRSSPPFKVIFLSRPSSTITSLLSAASSLELQDVRRPGETRRILDYLIDPEVFRMENTERNKLITMLEEKSDNCMQWAKLVVEHLSRVVAYNFADIERELKKLSIGPNGLDDTYLTLFNRHFTVNTMDYADSALRLIAAAVRPLTVEELAGAMIVNPLRSEIASKEDLQKEAQVNRIHALQPFVRITPHGSKITIHNTLRDLILRISHLSPTHGLRPTETGPSSLLHRTMAATCLDFLLLPYFRNNYAVSANDYRPEEEDWAKDFFLESQGVGEAVSPSTQKGAYRRVGPPFFAYASEFWAHHLSNSDYTMELIGKAIELSESGSTQCANWWKQYQFATGVSLSTQITPLLAAVFFRHIFTIKAMVQHPHKPGQDLITYDALTLAMEREDLEIFTLLYDAASGHELKTNGLWHLISALQIKKASIRKAIFDTLVTDPTVKLSQRRPEISYKNRTVLTEIASRGDVASLDSLLKCLDTDKRDDVIALLRDEGDAEGCSPLWYAANNGHTDIVNALCRLDLDLIRPQLHCPGKFGTHIVATAARSGDRSMMTTLLRVCPEYADLPCPGSNSPLSFLRYNSDYMAAEIAEALIATGAVDIDLPNELSTTSLMGAFIGGKPELCKVLIRHGADVGRIFKLSSRSELTCLVSTGFPARDVEILEALMELSEVKALSS